MVMVWFRFDMFLTNKPKSMSRTVYYKSYSVFVVLIVAFSLINSNKWFPHASLSSYYFFSISSLALFAYSAVYYAKSKEKFSLNISLLPVLFLSLYVALHGIFMSGGLSGWHYYYFSGTGFLGAVYLLLKTGKVQLSVIETGLVLLALIEVVICLLQSAGWVKSMNGYLAVSGSWVNPNVTAMFIALIFPVVFLRLVKKAQYQVLNTALLLVLLVGLYLLKCRSAYIGVFVSVLTICFYSSFFRGGNYTVLKKILIVVLLLTVIPVSFYLYNAKKASADGRMLIYKVSAMMIADKPLNGFGFGLFEKYYNDKQALYFRDGKATPKEQTHAAHVKMAYNEFLQHGVEGGVPALILYVGIFVVLLYRGHKLILNKAESAIEQEHLLIAISGIVAYMAMSLVNFTWQAIPATAVFLIYCAVLSSYDGWKFNFPDLYRRTIINLIFITALILLYNQVRSAEAMYKHKIGRDYLQQRKIKESLTVLEPLSENLRFEENYWSDLASSYLMQKQYLKAIEALNRAGMYSSKPAIFHLKAVCYEQQGMVQQAIANWQRAALLEPNRMLPHYRLMNLYINMHDDENALLKARELIAFKPKGISEKAVLYKRKAEQVLESLGNKELETKD